MAIQDLVNIVVTNLPISPREREEQQARAHSARLRARLIHVEYWYDPETGQRYDYPPFTR